MSSSGETFSCGAWPAQPPSARTDASVQAAMIDVRCFMMLLSEPLGTKGIRQT